jgi:hypothetical protein
MRGGVGIKGVGYVNPTVASDTQLLKRFDVNNANGEEAKALRGYTSTIRPLGDIGDRHVELIRRSYELFERGHLSTHEKVAMKDHLLRVSKTTESCFKITQNTKVDYYRTRDLSLVQAHNPNIQESINQAW